MSSTNWTQADLDALEEAIAKGIQRVKYSDKEIWYRSIKEMMQIRDEMRKCLGKIPKSGRKYAEYKSGLE